MTRLGKGIDLPSVKTNKGNKHIRLNEDISVEADWDKIETKKAEDDSTFPAEHLQNKVVRFPQRDLPPAFSAFPALFELIRKKFAKVTNAHPTSAPILRTHPTN